GDRFGTAYAHFVLGLVAAHGARDAVTARPHLEASRAAFAALGAPAWAAGAVMVLGNVARNEGEYPAAAWLYAEAEALTRPTGDTVVLGFILSNRAYLESNAGDPRLARRLWEDALAQRRAYRDLRELGNTLAALGRLALAEGDAATARRRLTEALAVQRDA